MAKGRLHFDGDNVGIEKEARIYSLTDDVERKINSIPNVIDNTSSTSATDALSANMGRDLQEQINNLASRGRYLSTWNAEIGLPDTNPQVSPYVYRAGDYYIVSNVVSGTNYRPHGSSYVAGEASTDVETESISVNDLYIYDGAQWIRQGSGSGATITWGSIVGVLSNQSDLQNALDDKQDELTAGDGISIDANNVISNTLPGAMVNATAPSNPSQGDLWYDTTNNKLKTYDGTQWNETGVTYVAGDNIQINGTTISATDTKYSAGRNITIGGNVINARDTEYTAGSNITITCPIESDMKGPCPSGYHVPLDSEWQNIFTALSGLGLSTTGSILRDYLKMPLCSHRGSSSSRVGNSMYYYTSSVYPTVPTGACDAIILVGGSTYVSLQTQGMSYGYCIRSLKNTPTIPDNTWTTLYDGSSVATGAGIFHNAIEGIISISADGNTRYTVADKNLGATTVYNNGDTMSEANCGKWYQWGNNYGFPGFGSTETVKTSPERVDASGYGPGNYYYSDIFYSSGQWRRQSSNNKNLWGGVTQGTWQDCEHPIISAAGGATYTAGTGINIDQNDEISVDTSVVATQTDLDTKQDTLTAGENIQIDTTTNTISATDTTYNAGENITIGDGYITENDMKGPCPSGYHIPTKNECDNLLTTFDAFNMSNSVKMFITYFKLTKTSYRSYFNGNAPSSLVEQQGDFWTCTKADSAHAYTLLFEDLVDRFKLTSKMATAAGVHIRPFKDMPAIPNNTWTTLYDGSSTAVGAGIFHNATEGLISISSDGTNWITIADKNLGATQVCNYGDSFTQENSGNYYQWGNNYGFPFTGAITTSGTKVDTSSYGPGNYYNSSTFTTASWSDDWSSVDNANLWGGVTQGTYQEYAHNVISAEDTTYTAGDGVNINQNNEISVDNTVARTSDTYRRFDVKNPAIYQSDAIAEVQEIYDYINNYSQPVVVSCMGANFMTPLIDVTNSILYIGGRENTYHSLSPHPLEEYSLLTCPFDSNGNILSVTYTNTQAQSPIITSGTAPVGQEGLLWYDTTNNLLKIYTGTTWISTGSSTTYTAGNGININANNEISADTTVLATQADIANFFDKTSDDADDIDDTNSTNKFVTATEKSTWNGKQDAIQDLSTIRSNATAGAGAATTIAGYGDIVSHDASEFATSAQGAKADTALQSGDNISELTNDAGYITNAYHDSTKQDTLIAGTNVQIDTNTNTISATDTTYTAGTGLGLSGTQFSVDSTVVALQSDLANYYTTSQTYSKTEVDNLISSFGSFTVVDTLPTAASADEKTIYLLGPIGTGADKYEEWIITRGTGNWASTTTMYPFTVNKNAWDGAIFIDSQTSPLSDFRGDCYVGAKLTSIGDETKLPVKLSFRADSSVDSEWVGLNEPAFAYNPDQYPNGDDLDIYIPNTSSSNSVSITAEGVMSSSPITWELGPKQWTKIGETSVDLTNYLNTSTQTSDVITEGSTNLFLTSAERTKIANSITGMTILSYGNSTWQDFIDAYSNNRVVYCRASSNSDPSTGSQGRLAFMAYVNNASNPTEVEFQYYRSRSSHSTAANVLDEVYVYKLTPTNGGTWTVTQRDTAAKPLAGTGIGLTYNASGMTISADTTTLATKTDLNSKQDTLVSGTNIKTVNNESLLGTGNITISAPTYTAGDNVQISSSNVISATDTKYNAGEGISIGNVTKNGRQGPSPRGFHVPSTTEWQGVKTIMDGLSLTDGADWKTNLHMPYAGIRVYDDAAINFQGNGGYYWASTPHETSAGARLSIGSGFARADGYDWRSNANSIRSFKDSYETPDSNWTVIQGTLGSAGIFWNQSEGLISITDGTTGYTIMDKNLGATVVYNNGNTLSQANMGNLYQWGNNYGFPSTGTITNTSSTQVDASGYGPTNPYSSETYIIGSTDWSSVQNDDLWGDTTGTYTQENVISNTVINSIQSSGPINVKKIWAGTTAQYNALSTYDADTIYIKVD